MKKLFMLSLLTIILVALGNQKSNAQNYEQGSKIAHLGVGIGGGFGIPISLSMDYGWKEKISLGGIVGFSTTSEDLVLYKVNYTYIMVAARGAYHFDLGVDKLDPYAGILLGYNVANVGFDPDPGPPFNNISAGGAIYGGFVGARYGISDKLGAFGELGYGIGNITLGVSYKF